MACTILLDAGVVGLICSATRKPNALGCQEWIERMDRSGSLLILSEVTYFEVKRGLLWRDATQKLARFQNLIHSLDVVSVTRDAWDKAAEFWALLHKRGQATADPKALDGDAVLAGVAVAIRQPGDTSVIATTNQRHLNRFPGVDARAWPDIN